MKILLLGAGGQLGQEVALTLASQGVVEACDRSQVDLTNQSSIAHKIDSFKPDVIVNAAAYTAVDKAESDQDLASLVNSEAVKWIAHKAAASGALVIHYSTDYVFDGLKTSAYKELDDVDPINHYGKTKLLGERALAESGCEHIIFRTTWVIGTQGNNFAKTILRLATEREALSVINDQFGVPTSPNLIARVTEEAIQAHNSPKPWPSGIYHLTPKGRTTWFGIAQILLTIAERAGVELKVNADSLQETTTDKYPTAAKRPSNSSLDTSKLEQLLTFDLPEWEDEFSDVAQHIIREAMQHET